MHMKCERRLDQVIAEELVMKKRYFY